MTIRERTEELEERMLAPYAALSKKSLGRDAAEEPCDIRTCYRRDCDRIIHCKAFRRLKRKTQVFLSPEGDHYRTRLTHTLEVSQIARTIARALGLNEDLTEAIALGHDLGHTPFGHAGERAISHFLKNCPEAQGMTFSHNVQSLRIVEKLENGSLTRLLNKEYHMKESEKARSTVEVSTVSQPVAGYLRMNEGEPVMILASYINNEKEEPLYISYEIIAGSRYKISI